MATKPEGEAGPLRQQKIFCGFTILFGINLVDLSMPGPNSLQGGKRSNIMENIVVQVNINK